MYKQVIIIRNDTGNRCHSWSSLQWTTFRELWRHMVIVVSCSNRLDACSCHELFQLRLDIALYNEFMVACCNLLFLCKQSFHVDQRAVHCCMLDPVPLFEVEDAMIVPVNGVCLLPTSVLSEWFPWWCSIRTYLSGNHQVYTTIVRFAHNIRDNVVKEVLHCSLASEPHTLWLNHNWWHGLFGCRYIFLWWTSKDRKTKTEVE